MGAQFAVNYDGKVKLFCFNKPHYAEKEALGKQEYLDSLKPQQEAADYQDADIVKGLVDGLDETSARALGLCMLQRWTFGGINQGDEWYTREYSYHPNAVQEAMEIMGVELAKPEGWGRGIDQKKAIEAFNELGEASARQVAARLLSYMVRDSLGYEAIEQVLNGSGEEAKS
jgi:hypothetical protein